ncbi:MAG: hypothetical protein IPN90_12705 [Elusimicrobia bacterium]|nr:hypothetical protein [Elusimicrobiota bacterium]
MKRESGIFTIFMKGMGVLGVLVVSGGGLWGAFEEDARGARGVAMGDAYGAVADTADGLFWNPAALARVPMKQVLGTHADLFTGINNVDVMTDSLNYAHPTLRSGVWGLSWNSVNAKIFMGKIPSPWATPKI